MTCKQCIHHNVCYYAGRLKTKDSDGEKRIIAETNNVEDTCENFSARSAWVKLPCKVGGSLFILNLDKTRVQEMLLEAPAISCHCKPRIEEGQCCCHDAKCICVKKLHDFREIGKTVFLTREEAERALKDRSGEE